MRNIQSEEAWAAASRLTERLRAAGLTDKRAAFTAVYEVVLDALVEYERRRAREQKRLAPKPEGGG